MRLHEFYGVVQARQSKDLDLEVERAVHAVLAALAMRLGEADAATLERVLPRPLKGLLHDTRGQGRFDQDEFIEEVASRLDVDDDEAEQATLAVLGAIFAQLGPRDEAAQVLESLPSDLAHLMQLSG